MHLDSLIESGMKGDAEYKELFQQMYVHVNSYNLLIMIVSDGEIGISIIQ